MINIYTGKYAGFDNVIVGIQATYGGRPGPVHGRITENITLCTAPDPTKNIFIGQMLGRALNNDNSDSIIFSLGFKSNEGSEVCAPPGNAGNPLLGEEFDTPNMNQILSFSGKTTDNNMLGSLSIKAV